MLEMVQEVSLDRDDGGCAVLGPECSAAGKSERESRSLSWAASSSMSKGIMPSNIRLVSGQGSEESSVLRYRSPGVAVLQGGRLRPMLGFSSGSVKELDSERMLGSWACGLQLDSCQTFGTSCQPSGASRRSVRQPLSRNEPEQVLCARRSSGVSMG